MRSMTGYGSAKSSKKSRDLEINIRGVNGRFLDLRVHLPKEYHSIDAQLRKLVKQKTERGTIDLFIIRKSKVGAQQLELKADVLQQWMELDKKVSKKYGLKSIDSALEVLKLPEVLNFESTQKIDSSEIVELENLVKKALKDFNKSRETEGLGLKNDLVSRIKYLKKLSLKVQKLAKTLNQLLEEKLRKRIKEKSVEGFDESRLSQELVFYLDRCDVTEELVRANLHLKHMESLMNESGSIGKRLDFYCQELVREWNTTGSKVSGAELTQIVVEAKGTLEKMKEQVQNIE